MLIHIIYIYFILNTAITVDYLAGLNYSRINYKVFLLALLGFPMYFLGILMYLIIDLGEKLLIKIGLWVLPYYFSFKWKKNFKGIDHAIKVVRTETNPITIYFIKRCIMWHYKNRHKFGK